MIEPTEAQRSNLAARREPLGILTFLAPTDGPDGVRHLPRTTREVADAGGKRLLTLSVDQVLAGPALPFRTATLDQFRDGGSALQAWEACSKDLAATTSEAHVLVLRLDRMAPRVTRTLSRFHRLLRWLSDIETGRAVDPGRVLTPARIHSTPAQLDALLQGPPSEPFFNLNLTRFKSGEAGRPAVMKRVYRPSGQKLMALGGHASAGGEVVGTFVGAPGRPIDEAWNDVAIAAWPSREVFRTYLANVEPEVADARKELLERSIQLVCSSVENPAG